MARASNLPDKESNRILEKADAAFMFCVFATVAKTSDKETDRAIRGNDG